MNLGSRQPKLVRYVSFAVCCFLFVTSAFANNPVPTVVGPPVPQAVVPGNGEFTLTVYGANFVSGAVVNWNRSPRSTTFISARELQAKILASDIAKPTAGYITVTNPPPGGGRSSSSYALVEVHKPTKAIAVSSRNLLPSDSFYTIAADVNGDGELDLVSGEGSGPVTVNRGNGDGTFQIAATIGHGYFADAGIAIGDFNGDGWPDVVFGWGPISGDPPTHLKVLLGEGNDKFRGLPRFGLFADSYPRGMVAGDFNGDGLLDMVVAHEGGNFGGGVFLGNGDGTFKHVQSFSQGGDAVGADFNGDGNLDLVLEYGTGLYLRLGNGDGTFQKARRIATDAPFPGCGFGPSLVVNNFNGDGKADLAFCDDQAGRIGIVLGNGDGTFQHPVYYTTGFGAGNEFSFAVGDFNSDGKTDLIASTPAGTSDIYSADFENEFVVLWGKGDGTFQKATKISLPQNSGGEIGILSGDFNSDGLLDFVLAGNGGLSVYIQK